MNVSRITIILTFFCLLGTACTKQQDIDSNIIETTNDATENADSESMELGQQLIIEQYIHQNAKEYGQTHFLYDLTGDGFPELMKISEGASDYYNIFVYDFSDEVPREIGYFCAQMNESVYLCQDSKGNRFLISYYGQNMGFGASEYCCLKTNINEHILINSVLGECICYYEQLENRNNYLCYNSTMYFNGEQKENLGYYEENSTEQSKQEIVLLQYVEEYLKEVEVLDTFTMPEYGEEEVVIQIMQDKISELDFVPNYNYEEWFEKYQKEVEDRSVMICGELYDSQSVILSLQWDKLDSTFDSNVLNEFPNLREVNFDGNPYVDSGEKIAIKSSDWSEKIEKISIYPELFIMEGDMKSYSNLRELTLYGDGEKMGDLGYVSQIPDMKILNLWLESVSIEFIEQISMMPTIEVVTCSGHLDFYGDMTDGEKEQVANLLLEKLFIWVK